MAWAERMGIHIQYIQPGKPQHFSKRPASLPCLA